MFACKKFHRHFWFGAGGDPIFCTEKDWVVTNSQDVGGQLWFLFTGVIEVPFFWMGLSNMLESSFFAGVNCVFGGQVWEDPESWLVVRLHLTRWAGSVGL
jgi:hypothetical protein